MELKYLITVKKIIETGSYQRAALALHYAQSTITFQIRQLEQELGAQLFERSGSRMVLTQAGEELIPLIDKVLDSVDMLKNHCKVRDGLHGTLTIALPESLLTYQLQNVLKEFKEKAPRVQMCLKVMNCFAIRDQMRGSDIDIAIHYDVGEYSKSFTTRQLKTFPLALVCSPVLSEDDRDFISPNQHKALCHIQNDRDALSLKIFQQYLGDKAITMETELEVWSMESIKRSVISNLGVAFLPRFTVEEELHTGALIALPTEIAKPEMTAIYVTSKGRWKSPAMELFSQILAERFA